MSSPPPHLDRPTPELRAWFPLPERSTWEQEARAGGKGPPLSSELPGLGPVDVLHGPGVARAVPGRGAGPWDVRPVYEVADVAALAAELSDDRGAGSVGLVPHGALRGVEGGGTLLVDLDALDRALKPVDLGVTPVAIEAGAAPLVWTAALAALADRRGTPREAVRGFVHACPLSTLLRHGQADVEGTWDQLAAAARATPWRLLTVDARVVGEAGGEAIDELVWAVAGVHALLVAMQARGLGPAEVAPRVTVRVGVGLDLFTEIGKLRALRLLWDRLLRACGVEGAPLYVHAVASSAALTRQLPHTNLVRASVQGFAAAVGGADAITLLPFDRLRGAPSPLALRQACTAQGVLAWEAGLAGLQDPAAGAGLVEELTWRLATAAWSEAAALDTLEAALRSGALQGRLQARQAARTQAIAARQRLVVGVNLQPAPESTAGDVPAGLEAAAPVRADGFEGLVAQIAAGAPFASLVAGLAGVGRVTAPAVEAWSPEIVSEGT